MTGQHTGHARVRFNGKIDLRAGDPTWAEILRAAGYETALIGKWGLGAEGSVAAPNRKGFDHFFGYADQHHAHNYYPTFLLRDGGRVKLRNVVPDEGEYGQGNATVRIDYAPDLMIEDALDFIGRERRRPFLLYFATILPHANNQAPAGKSGMEIPDYGRYADRDWPEAEEGFAAMVTRLDTDVGRLLSKLEERGLAENTLVIFTSDNGPHRENGHDPAFFGSSGGLRGIKADVYEGGLRVPAIARWPGMIPAGGISESVGYFADIFPTFVELAGAQHPHPMDGVSFLRAMTGSANVERPVGNPLYWEFYRQGDTMQAVRKGNWKAVRRPMKTGNIELYNLRADPAERDDVADRHPEVAVRLAKIMVSEHRDLGPGERPEDARRSRTPALQP